jgi:hypothetical protein
VSRQVLTFWEELIGILSLDSWPKVLWDFFLSLNSCNAVTQLGTPPLGKSH